MLNKWRMWAVPAILFWLLPAVTPCGGPAVAVEVADLQQQLESGLRARLPREFRFIENVVQLAAEDRLPIALVKSTFQWARRKAAGGEFPFPYFERAMRLRAKRLGVTIPD